MRMRRTMRGISYRMVTSSADSRITIFSRGIVIVETAPGRHDTQAVCMILPPCMAAALRFTMSWPAADNGALGTMKPKVFGSHTPAKRGVVAAGFAAAAGCEAGDFARDDGLSRRGHLFRRFAAGQAIGAHIVRHPRRRVAMEGEHGFPRLRVVLRIIDGDAILEPAVGQHAQPFGERQLLGVRQARCIHHRCIDQPDGADHQGVAFPAAHRESHRERQWGINRAGAHVHRAEPAIPAVDERDAVGVGADLQRILHGEDARHARARAPGGGVERRVALRKALAAFGIQLRCLGGERGRLAAGGEQRARGCVGHPDAEQCVLAARGSRFFCRDEAPAASAATQSSNPRWRMQAHGQGAFAAWRGRRRGPARRDPRRLLPQRHRASGHRQR